MPHDHGSRRKDLGGEALSAVTVKELSPRLTSSNPQTFNEVVFDNSVEKEISSIFLPDYVSYAVYYCSNDVLMPRNNFFVGKRVAQLICCFLSF